MGLAAAVGAGAGLYLFLGRSSGDASVGAPDGPKAWYTQDDGKTWFADSANRLTPFDHGGKPAYRCSVWSCDGGKTKFVSHLERYKARVLNDYAGKGTVNPWELPPGMVEVRPVSAGESGWVAASTLRGESIVAPRCPHNDPSHRPEPVVP